MEATLHCNDIKCRALCDERAVATTCCHVFCLPCADRLGLTASRDGQRRCPACGATLNNPDDVAIAQLNPSEDYKSSVLAGLNPTIIVEIAGRGLTFWNYQMTQEMWVTRPQTMSDLVLVRAKVRGSTYQKYLEKSLTTKCHSLNAVIDSTVKQANDVIKSLETRLQDAYERFHELQSKHEKLVESYQDKSKSQATFEKLYNNLKQQQIAAELESAAEQNANNVLYDASGICHHSRKKMGGGASLGSASSDKLRAQVRETNPWPNGSFLNAHGIGMQSSQRLHVPHATRTRLPQTTPRTFTDDYAGTGLRASEHESLRRGTPNLGTFNDIIESVAAHDRPPNGFIGAKRARPLQNIPGTGAKASDAR